MRYTDSIPTLESIASLKGVVHKELAMELCYLTDKLEDERFTSYSWVMSKRLVSDMFTKKMKEPNEARRIFLLNEYERGRVDYNNVYITDDCEAIIENLVDRNGNPRQ